MDDGNEDPTVGSELASLEKVRLIRQVVRGLSACAQRIVNCKMTAVQEEATIMGARRLKM